ncbi:MAG TPA: hypothetical protein VFK97_01475 [Candidatus Saccharimonadales bacterium]|nr:hypothetical protein [Candidatus Saccharimonadales bacterium]
MRNIKKNMFGFAHHALLGVAVIAIISFVGVKVLTAGHALTPDTASTDSAVMKLPNHLMDGWWGLGTNKTLTSISSDMVPGFDPSPDGYFYATSFWWPNNKGGYMGLQTESEAKAGQIIPKTVSATIYGATGTTAAYVPPWDRNILAQCGNRGEGHYCSLTAPYNWTPGHTYRFKMSLQSANDGSGNSIWAFQALDTTADITIPLGTIKIPASWGNLAPSIGNFHERFSGPTKSCSQIKSSAVLFLNASGDNGKYSGKAVDMHNGSTNCSGALKNKIVNNTFRSVFMVPSN